MADLPQPNTLHPSQSNSYSWARRVHSLGDRSEGLPASHQKTTRWRGYSLLLLLSALLGVGGIPGCAGLAGPNWRHPGTAQTQQLRALQFDPYPEGDLGPSVEGARPMEFQNPPPDIQRSRPHELRRRWFPWQTSPP